MRTGTLINKPIYGRKRMIYWLSGATGFVGRNLLNLMTDDVVLIDRKTNLEYLYSQSKPDYIIHLAGELDHEGQMFESNVGLTYDLLEATIEVPYKAFIYVGSSSEYGAKEKAIGELDSLEPRNLYEATKACGSMLCKGYARQFNKPIVIARPFSLYGPHDKFRKLMNVIDQNFLFNQPIQIAPGNHDWLHVDDFIRGLLGICAQSEKIEPGEVVNFGTGIMHSNEQVLELMVEILKRKYQKKSYQVDKIKKIYSYDSDMWVCDTKKAFEKYGWKAEISLKEGLESIYA
jgi:GDP-4-dehydro-6-deoxy-D-mannose reductase